MPETKAPISQTSLSARLESFLFRQQHPFERIALLRISAGLLLTITLLFVPYDHFFADFAPYMYRPHGLIALIPPLSLRAFLTLKYLTLASALCLTLGYFSRFSCIAAALLFFLFNGYVSAFSTRWNYNTHLIFLLFLLSFAEISSHLSIDRILLKKRNADAASDGSGYASFVLAFMQTMAAVIYLNAGLSKLSNSGPIWFYSGATIKNYIILNAHSSGYLLGLRLLGSNWIFPAIGLATGMFELGFIFALAILGPRPILGYAALIFHGGIHSLISIPFFHLWGLYPALFILKNGKAHPAADQEE